MSAAYFIVLEREIEDLDAAMDGKSLSKNIGKLDDAARQLGVRPLSEFFSLNPEEAEEFMQAEGMNPDGIKLPPLKQFTAQEGLTTVRALAAHTVAKADGVARDLQECERILSAAAQHEVGWHFEVDF
jgi:hypothetical protein